MRPGTRSSAQSYKQPPPPDEDRNSDYASSPPEALGIEYDGRETVRLQRFEANQYTGNSVYSPTSPLRSHQNINAEIPRRTHQPVTSIRQLPLDEDLASAAEETSSSLPRSSNKPNLRDGRVRIRPRGCSLVSFILACLSVAFLGLVAHSFLNLQRDPKGCKMSFMYPSYAKLSDFDTEHTRFATKYSLYLYREQKKDLSMEVSFPLDCS
jgi:GPI inositol-deacylase